MSSSEKVGRPTMMQSFLAAYIMVMFHANILDFGGRGDAKWIRIEYTSALTLLCVSKDAGVPEALPRESVTLGIQDRDGGSTTTG